VEANAFATLFCNYPYYGKVAETLFEKGLCLPSGSNLTDEERTRIKRVVLNMFKNSAILVKIIYKFTGGLMITLLIDSIYESCKTSHSRFTNYSTNSL
jgi:hypothetical protein